MTRIIFAVLLAIGAGCQFRGARVDERCGDLLDSCSDSCKVPAEAPMPDPAVCYKVCAEAYAVCRQDR